MDRKRECIINCLLIFLTIAHIVFVIFYDHYRIKAYVDGLKQTEAGADAPYVVAAMIVFVFFNICILGGGSAILTILLSIFTRRLAKNNGKPKKAALIAVLVCKIIGFALMVLGACIVLALPYADGVIKFVYVFVPITYFCAIMHSAVFFKKIIV